MNTEDRTKKDREIVFDGPLSKVVLTFSYEEDANRDHLMIAAYDEQGNRQEHVFVGLRHAKIDDALLMYESHQKE